MITEVTKINVDNVQFRLKVATNEDPNKTGVKVQFIPMEAKDLPREEFHDIAMKLQNKLNTGLTKYGMSVERDRQLKDKAIIGFFIYIEYLDQIIRKVLKGENEEEL